MLIPAAFKAPAKRRVVSGCEVEVSTTNNPGLALVSIPFGPLTTCSTMWAVGSDNITISHSETTSPIVSRTEIPSLAKDARIEGLTSVPTTSNPFRLRVKAIPRPIFPRPIKPTFLNIS